MVRTSWLRRLKSLFWPKVKPIKRVVHQVPRLEALEDRLAPATFTWTGGGNGNWSDGNDWVGGIAPTGNVNPSTNVGDDLVFGAGAAQLTAFNDIGGTFNSITIAASGYTLKGDAITLGTSASGSGYLIDNANASNNIIDFNIQMGGAGGAFQFFTVNSGGALNLAGNLTGNTSTISKEGTGTLILSGDNSGFGGSISIDANAGILEAETATALGSSAAGTTVGINSQLQVYSTTTPGITISENLILNGAGPDGYGSLRNVAGNNFWSGAITLDSNSSIGSDSGNLTITGAIGDTGASGWSLTKVGNAQVSLAAADTYRAGTVVQDGILSVENPLALGYTDGTAATGVLVEADSLTQVAGTLQLDDPTGVGFTVQNVLLTANGPGYDYPSLSLGIYYTGVGAIDNYSGNNTWTGNVVLGSVNPVGLQPTFGAEAATTANPNTTLTITGIVQSNADTNGDKYIFDKVGLGKIILAGANTYTTATTVDNGTLEMTNANAYTGVTTVGDFVGIETGCLLIVTDSQALGPTGNEGQVTVFNGDTLELAVPVGHVDSVTGTTNSIVVSAVIDILGLGISIGGKTVGAIYNASGINTITSNILIDFFTSEAAIGVAADPNPSSTVSYYTNDYHLMITGNIIDNNPFTSYGQQLDKVGFGDLILPASNPGLVGLTDIKQGWITVGNNVSVGPTRVENGASLMLLPMNADGTPNSSGTFILTQTLALTGLGISKPSSNYSGLIQEGALVVLDGSATVSGFVYLNGMVGIGVESLFGFASGGSLVTTGQIRDGSPPGGITKLGSQRLTIQGDGTYTGDVDVNQGVLRVQNDTALGAEDAGTVTVAVGAVLELMGSEPANSGTNLTDSTQPLQGLEIWDKTLVLNGTGDYSFNDYSPLMNLEGDNAWRGNITLGNSMAVDVLPNTTLAVFGVVDDGALDTTPASPADIVLIGGGELQLYGTNAYRGTTYIGTATDVANNTNPDNVIPEVQSLTVTGSSGTFTLAYGSASIVETVGVSASQLQTDIDNLSTIIAAKASVFVTESGSVYTITFQGKLGAFPQALLTTSLPSTGVTAVVAAATPADFTTNGILTVANSSALGTTVTSEVQTVDVTGNAGTFTLTFNGSTTAALAYNATALQVQTALNGLVSTNGVNGAVTVVQSAISGGLAYAITFVDNLAGFNLSKITGTGTGGTSVTVTTTTVGSGGVMVDNGASLQLQGNVTIAGKPLIVQGTGVGNVPSTMSTQWFSLGSAPTQETNPQEDTSGRVTGVVVNPGDNTNIFISTAGGGAWETKNDGLTWEPMLITAGVTFSGAIAEADTGVLYIGTGEADNSSDSYYGTGVYYSTDSGITWSLLTGPNGYNPLYGTAVSSMVTGYNFLYVATSDQAANGPLGNAGVWRYNGTWYNLTAVVSYNRENTTSTNPNNASPAPPKTAGPDDDYRISFPQTDATWSDLAMLNGTLYASLGTALGTNPYNAQIADNSNGVYSITNYATASGSSGNSNAPVWDVGPGGVDTESSSEFPTAKIQTVSINNYYNSNFSLVIETNSGQYESTGSLSSTASALTVQNSLDALSYIYGVENGGISVTALFTGTGTSSTSTYTFFFEGKVSGNLYISYAGTGFPGIAATTLQSPNENVKFSVDVFTVNNISYQWIYASTTWNNGTSDGVLHQILWSANLGSSWQSTDDSASPGPYTLTPTTNYMGTQGNYDSTFSANGLTLYVGGSNTILMGTISLATNTFGKITWTNITTDTKGDSPADNFHASTVNLDYNGANLYVGTDGGIWEYVVSSGLWEDLNGNLSITEYDSISVSASNLNSAVGGTQSSGVGAFTGSNVWNYINGVNGTQVAIDPENDQNVYIAYDGGIYKSTTGVDGAYTFLTNFLSASPITSLLVDPLNSNRILAVNASGLYQSLNGGTSWSYLNESGDLVAAATYQGTFATDPGFPLVTDQGTSTYVPNTLYVANGATVSVTKNGGLSWVTRSPNFGIPPTTIEDIIVDPTNENTAYVVVNQTKTGAPDVGSVYMTTNAGQTWSKLTTTGLPKLPAWSLVLDPRTETLYLGTDNGVWDLTSTASSWTQLGTGMTNVQVKSLQLNQALNTLTAGTYGLGMFVYYIPDLQLVANGGALRSVSGAAVWTGPVELDGPTTISAGGSQALANGVSSATLNIVGVISDTTSNTSTNTLTKVGEGNVILSGTNVYGGVTYVQQGNLVVNNAQALGSTSEGTIVEYGSSLELQTSVTTEPLTLYGNGSQILNGHYVGALYNVSNNNTYSGPIELMNYTSPPSTPISPTGIADVTIGVASGSVLTISGVIDDTGSPGGPANLDKELTGTLILSAANTYRGYTNVYQGTLTVQNGQALGNSAGYTTVYNGSVLQLQGGITVNNETLDLSGTGANSGGALISSNGANAWDGIINLQAIPGFSPITTPPTNVSINVVKATDSLTVGGVVGTIAELGGNFGLIKIGLGTLVLPNADSYNGLTQISSGIVDIKNNQSLGVAGSPPSGGTVVSSGAELELDSTTGITVTGETLTLNGTGIANAGAIVNDTGANTWTGNVIVNTTSSISVLPTTELTLSGVLSQPTGVTSALSLVGGGLLDLISSTNTFTGKTTVTAGDLQVDNNLGAITLNGATKSAATLSGVGTVGAVTATIGTVSPGDNAPGILTTGQETWSTNTAFNVNLASTGNGSELVINGGGTATPFNLGSASLTGTIGSGVQVGDSFVVLSTTNSATLKSGSTFSNAPSNVIILDGVKFSVAYNYTLGTVTLTRLALKTATVTITSTPASNPAGTSIYGQAVVFTITVKPVTGTPLVTGDTVSVTFNGGAAFNLTLSSGKATYTPTGPLAIGSYVLTAQFNGDVNYDRTQTPVSYTQTVNAVPTAITLPTTSQSIPGQSVTITATVVTVPAGDGTPTGTVTLTVTSPTLVVTTLGPTAVSTNGGVTTASFTLDSSILTDLGTYPLTAVFTATPGGNYASSQTTGTYSQVVGEPPAATSVTLTQPASPAAANFAIPITAKVGVGTGKSPSGVPVTLNVYVGKGTSTPYSGSPYSGNANASGSVTFNPLLPAGTYTVQAVAGSVKSAALSLTVVTPTLVFTTTPKNDSISSTFTTVVKAEDPTTKKVLTNFTGQVTLGVNTGPTGGVFLTTPVQTAVAGVATFTGLGLSTTGTYTLSASLAGTTTGISTSLLVYDPTVVTSLAITGVTISGFGLKFKVEALNAIGGVVTSDSDTATVQILSGPGSLTSSSTTTVTLVNGIGTFSNVNVTGGGTYKFEVVSDALTVVFSESFFSRVRL